MSSFLSQKPKSRLSPVGLSKFETKYTAAEQDLIKRAHEFAARAHAGQKRLSGQPFISHCEAVALILIDLNLDAQAVAAALLHDVAEDTAYNLAAIRGQFGGEIANLVDGLTKLDKVRITKRWLLFGPTETLKLSQFDHHVETLRKLFLATAKDLRVILIKLADRLHNIKTIKTLPPERRVRYALETLELYAPIAYRLGMNDLKGELEDLAFPHAYPGEYQNLRDLAGPTYEQCRTIANLMRQEIGGILKKNNIPAQTDARSKHRFSLWKKLQRKGGDLKQIYDLVAVRVIVVDIETCYKALDLIQQRYRPLENRLKDYIAHPKPNGYQSIHVTVYGPKNQPIEVQIRTQKQHEQAEFGVAAHWSYKAASEGRLRTLIKKFSPRELPREAAWIRDLAEIGKKLKNPEELAKRLKIDFFGDRIFPVTPKGDVKDLPQSATALDFAYALHTEIGSHAVGVKINDKIAKLSTTLKTTDKVEITTSPKARPSPDWLEIVKTHHARSSIRRALRLRGLIPIALRNPLTGRQK